MIPVRHGAVPIKQTTVQLDGRVTYANVLRIVPVLDSAGDLTASDENVEESTSSQGIEDYIKNNNYEDDTSKSTVYLGFYTGIKKQTGYLRRPDSDPYPTVYTDNILNKGLIFHTSYSGMDDAKMSLAGESMELKVISEHLYKEDYDISYFDKIMVPGHIELAGYDQIRYINTLYPWEGKTYRRGAYSIESAGDGTGMFSEAEYNPVGSYIKKFDLDKELCGKRVRLFFEGVEQAMYVWLNGEFIGYAEDSFTPSEFDLTPYIREKDNVLAVEIHKMCSAAFLEDQDFFRFFGIFRNVSLRALPEAHVEDMWLNPVLNEDNVSGTLNTNIRVSATENQDVCARIILKNVDDQVILERNIELEDKDGDFVGSISDDIKDIKKWDNHTPYLYKAYIELLKADGEIIEVVPYRIGFRRIEIKNKVMLLNGERLIINGVNRHEWNPKTGRCIGLEDMVSDINCMTRNNINAVRTCHYPDQIPWYYMCDDAGIYVMAETNLESHGSWQKLGAV